MTSPTTMTLHYWLTVALKDLPEPVQLRLEDEYRAHLLDSDSPDDVRGVLGDPAEVNKQLSKLYVSANKLNELEEAKRGLVLLVHATIAAMTLLGGWIAWHSQGKDLTQLFGPVLVLLISAVVWGCTARLPPVKRQFMRSSWTVNALNVMLWSGWTISLLSGQSLGAFMGYYVTLFPALMLCQFWLARQNYLRLDRTLRLLSTPN
jgi:hypothetical protein